MSESSREEYDNQTTQQEQGKAALIQRSNESLAVHAQGDATLVRKTMAKLIKVARDRISATQFAFPKQRKEPLENASHVANAAARFNQVNGVTEAERRAAWKR